MAIDLNLEEDLSASYICGITGAPVRLAIGDRAEDRYYNNASTALAIRLTVVSWPAISSRLQVATISSPLS